MSKPLTLTELKKELKKMDHSDLVDLISNLYKSNDTVKEIISVKFVGEKYQAEMLEVYKEKIFAEVFPKNMKKIPSFKVAKDLITDFKKVGSFEMILDLMLYFVECGTTFTIDFGDMDGPFYGRLCSVYGQFVDQLDAKGTEDLYLTFKKRIDNLISSSSNVGWGYGDYIFEKSLEIEWLHNER